MTAGGSYFNELAGDETDLMNPDEEALEVTLLRFPNSQMNLGNRSREDQHHRRDETNDRQLQRRDDGDQSAQHF